MEGVDESPAVCDEERVEDALTPAETRDDHGDEESNPEVDSEVVLPLERQDRVVVEIVERKRSRLDPQLWMLLPQQPATVGEEESPSRVVWISICVRELVMHTMIPSPGEG